MSICTEIAIFTIKQADVLKAIELSEKIFSEMNAENTVITAYQILQKTDKPEELCWLLTWISPEAAKATTQNWPSFPSTKAFQALVVNDLYYGHFVRAEET